MHVIRTALAVLLATGLATSAVAQGYAPPPGGRPGQGFDDRPAAPPPPQSQGFNIPGDQITPSHDPQYYGHYDPRYSQTFQQQQAEPPRPGGGCLRYGAVGAAGGHLAGHGVAGALAGCAIGHFVRRRNQQQINEQYGRQ